MTARADIQAGKFKDAPAAIAALRAAGTGPMADLFASFVGYASVNWNYAATSGTQTAHDLLTGDGPKNVACGTLREALKIMVRGDFTAHPAENADINGFFLTKPGLACFDPKVKGNVGNRGATTFNLCCHFSTHYFMKVGAKFYNPCLTAVYTDIDGPVAHKTRVIQGVNMRKAGTTGKSGWGKAIIFIRVIPGKTVPGFQSVYEILTPAECKTALSPLEFAALKKDPDVMAAKLF